MEKLLTPPKEALLYENDKLYICLASFPLTPGHTIVVWKKDAPDIHSLSREEYEYLMNTVDIVRNVLLSALHVEKVYLLYMDEIQHVHWHLVPRYEEKGAKIFTHSPREIHDFPLAPILAEPLKNLLGSRI